MFCCHAAKVREKLLRFGVWDLLLVQFGEFAFLLFVYLYGLWAEESFFNFSSGCTFHIRHNSFAQTLTVFSISIRHPVVCLSLLSGLSAGALRHLSYPFLQGTKRECLKNCLRRFVVYFSITHKSCVKKIYNLS